MLFAVQFLLSGACLPRDDPRAKATSVAEVNGLLDRLAQADKKEQQVRSSQQSACSLLCTSTELGALWGQWAAGQTGTGREGGAAGALMQLAVSLLLVAHLPYTMRFARAIGCWTGWHKQTKSSCTCGCWQPFV
jgi:hypothetical protein